MKVSFCGYIYADFSSDLGKCSSVLNHMCFYSSKLVRFTKSPQLNTQYTNVILMLFCRTAAHRWRCDPTTQTHTKADRQQSATRQSGGFPPYQLAEFVGQLLDHDTEALQLLKHADQVLTGEATDHLQIFSTAKNTGREVIN